VLALLAEGRTNKEICLRLGCSQSAVEQHVTMLCRKSGAGNRTTLLRLFWRGG
jgi:DNA-binding NarL/FixJ family response regulator